MKDTLWLVILQGVNYLLPLFVWPYLMVTLCADGFGKLGFALSLAQFFMLVVDFGFNLSATKQVALAKDDADRLSRIATDTLAAKLLLLATCGLLLAGVVMVPEYAPYRMMCIIAFLMVVGNTFTWQWLYQGLGKIRLVSIVNCLSRILILPLTFLLVHGPENGRIAILIQAGTYLLSGIVMCAITGKMHLFRLLPFEWKQTVGALIDSLPIFLSTAASSIYTMLFVVILGYAASTGEVGQYTAAEKIARVSAYLLLLPTLQSFFPRVSQLAGEQPLEARRITRHIMMGLTLLMLLLTLLIFFFANPIMGFLGKGYQESDTTFRIMAFLPPLLALSGTASQLGLIAQGGEAEKRWFRNVYLVAAIVALLIIACGCNRLNASYTALAMILAEAVAAAGMLAGYFRFLKK